MARILIVEDEREIRANLRRFLVLEGHEVLEAQNGVRGLELALSGGIDLVLCDVLIPELDGFAVLQRLRAAPHTSALPFIFLTASAEAEAVARAMDQGANGYIIKPFDFETLAKAIARTLLPAR